MSIIINPFRYYQEAPADGAPEFFGVIPNITAIIDAGSFTYDVAQHYSNNPTSYALQNEPTLMDIDNTGLLTYTPTTEENIGGISVTATNADGFAESNIFSAIAQIDNTILIDDFNLASEPNWTINHGSTIAVTTTFGAIVDYGVPEDTMKVVQVKSSSDSDWVTISRTNISPSASWSDAIYINLSIAVEKDVSWYMSLHLTAGGITYEHVLHPYDYVTGLFQNKTVKLSDISPAINPEEITGVKLEQNGQWENTFYWNKLSLLREEVETPTVIFTTNEPTNNMFEPGSSINMIFTIGSLGILAGAEKLEYEIYNYSGLIVDNAEITLDGSNSYQVSTTATETEYYEVIAYWLDSSDDRMEIRSCIEPKGSLRARKGTYAVVASTIEDSSTLLSTVGYDAFFGLHLNYNSLAAYIGCGWKISFIKWNSAEPVEPNYIDGMAEWAYNILQGPEGAQDAKSIRLLRMNIYRNLPDWVSSSSSDPAPGMNDVEDFYRYFTDRVKVHKHIYPGMTPRIYDPLWEVNLNDPDSISTPEWYVADVKEAYRRCRLIIDAEDPTALLCGPGVSSYTKNWAWMEEMADGGVFQYLDGFHGHGYNTAPPETGDVREKTRDLKTLFASQGISNAPLYITELGYRSQYGSLDLQAHQAKLHVRCAIILKGEDVNVYTPFYAYDFTDDSNSWGFMYNLDSGLPFAPDNTSPKSLVPAFSVLIKELEGAPPVRDITTYGADIWCYIFNNISNEPTIVLWTIGNNQVLDIDVGSVSTVTVTDFMGHDFIEPVANGIISYYITDAPIYIKGATWAAVGGTP